MIGSIYIVGLSILFHLKGRLHNGKRDWLDSRADLTSGRVDPLPSPLVQVKDPTVISIWLPVSGSVVD